MAALTASADRAHITGQPGLRGPSRTVDRLATADRSAARSRPGKTVRSWPLLVLAVPAAAEVWSGWVGIARMTGFGLVPLLLGPGRRVADLTAPRPARRISAELAEAAEDPAETQNGPMNSPSG